MMRAVLTVGWKEIVENIREKRTLFSALVFGPLFGPCLFALMMTLMLDRVTTSADEKIALTVGAGERAPNLIRFLREHGVAVTEAKLTPDEARGAVRDGKHPTVLLVSEDYPDRFKAGRPAPVILFFDSSDQRNGKYVTQVQNLLKAYSDQLGATRLFARGIDPEVVRPVFVDRVDVSTPAGRSVLLLGMMTYFILFSMLMGGLYLTIDATAGERERGSLEVLFTAPVPRESLIHGKILAATFYMLISLAVTLTAFGMSLRFIPLESLGMSANLNPGAFAKLFFIAAPFAPFGAALMTVVASFTRTYKEAQSYLSLVLLVPTLPILFAGLYALKSSEALMAVPSLGQHLLMTRVLKDEPLFWSHLGISICATLTGGLLLTWIAGRLYRREAILG